MKGNHKQAGYIAVTLAVLTATLFGMVALAVDIGVIYRNRTQVQQIADSAALAGAFAYVTNPNATQSIVSDQVNAVASSQLVANVPLAIPGNVSISAGSPATRRVLVTISNPASTRTNLFARVFPGFFRVDQGLSSTQLRGTAIAVVYPNATSATGVRPWFLPTTIVAPASGIPGLANAPPCVICQTANNNNVLIKNGAVTALARSAINHATTGFVFDAGAATPSAALIAGQFFSMRMGASGGVNYTNNIATNSAETISCNTLYPLESSADFDLTTATANGVTTLVGNPATDTWLGVAQYKRGAITFDTSKALVAVPLWDPCSETTFLCPAGRFAAGVAATPKVVGFAVLFVSGMSGGNVSAHLVNLAACAPGAPLSGSAPYGIPVRLVREQ